MITPIPDISDPSLCGGRLTLTTATPVLLSDATTQGTLYFTPYKHAQVALYNGSGWRNYTFTERSLANSFTTHATPTGNVTNLSATVTSMSSTTGLYAGEPITGTGIPTGTVILSVDSSTQVTMSANGTATNSGVSLTIQHANYDVFLYDNAGTLTLETLAWSDNNTRATALVRQDGVWCKTGALTRRYLGTVRASGSNLLEDSRTRRFVWNHDNPVSRSLYCLDTTDNWTYTTATHRPANNTVVPGISRVLFVQGLLNDEIEAYNQGLAYNSGGNPVVVCGIGIDSTTANSAVIFGGQSTTAAAVFVGSQYRGMMSTVGFHYLQRLEYSQATGTTYFYGDGGALFQGGLQATIKA